MSIVVARIAPEPVSMNVAVSDYRSRPASVDTRVGTTPSLLEDPLPPVLEPVPTPVPAPAIQPPSEAFAAAVLAEQMPASVMSPSEYRLRQTGNWQAPTSQLRLADRRI